MLTTCSEPGCATLVMGGRCIEHEQVTTRVFVRGRPLVAAPPRVDEVVGHGAATLATNGATRTVEARDGVPHGLEPSRN
jgi:hypothetical protein